MDTAVFRPPQEILDVFWSLSDGTDEERTAGTVKLCKLIEKSSDDIKRQILKYCLDRLIRGLSSNRKFARVGFSVGLVQLLRHFKDLALTSVLDTMKEKLKLVHQEQKSKAAVGDVFMGRAFAISAIIQSGRISQLDDSELDSVLNELLKMSEKKSYLKPVSHKITEDLISQISPEKYEAKIWPKLKVKLQSGWELCTLDKLSLLIRCREMFPKVTKKKFVHKYWGFPLFSEDNDDKLLKAILDTTQKTELLLEKILPHMLKCDRDIVSIWKSIGEKLMQSLRDNRKESMSQRQCVGLQLATKLLSTECTLEQLTEFILIPNLARCLFYFSTQKNDALEKLADALCDQVVVKLKEFDANILEIVKQIWKLEVSLSEPEKSKILNLVSSHNFTRIIDLLSESQAEKYVHILTSAVKGKDKWSILLDSPEKQTKLIESCLRHLQHITCSQKHTTPQLQQSVLSLFLRLACFKVEKKTKSIEHCERCCNYDLEDSRQTLCESSFYKCLDSLSTLKHSQHSKWEQFSKYLQLLCHLVEYIQTLLTTEDIKPLKPWPEEIKSEWNKLFALVTNIKKEVEQEKDVSLSSAFLLLFLFLGINMLTDFKTSTDLLKDVYICYERATKEKKKKKKDDEDEPHWVEVVTEVLLSLLLLPSHLGRVITTTVFKAILGHMTPTAVGLITDVLIPKKVGADDAGGVLVDTGAGGDEDDDEDELEDLDDTSGEDEAENSNEEEMEADEEEEEVDETFRKSVKEALGKAAADKEDESEEEELPDLSDSEMFQLDDMLAEVFRQKKLAGGKKARQEKKKETDNFRIRILDLVETIIKSERCGDFVIDLLKPVLLLMLKTNPVENQVLCDKSKSLFALLRSKAKGQKDSIHSEDYHKNILIELIELAQSVVDSNHLQAVAAACFTVMNLSCGDINKTLPALPSHYVDLLRETLHNVIKKPKNSLQFLSLLIDLDPLKFQMLAPNVLSCLKDESTKTHSKMICCSLLVSLAKKTGTLNDTYKKTLQKWMTEALSYIQELILSLEKQTSKVKFTNNVLSLAVALQSRTDIFQQNPFDVSVSSHLLEIKSSFNTDLRRLANKIIAAIARSHPKVKAATEKKRNKDQVENVSENSPAKKKKKV
ncbi:rDNA transcriptional regulator pol5 isoform X2 [Biomphalaria pfeifferi]|uniref:rDNA transcriptional regulator pol5 isoform X2 n=1 Tax=Biomphalaria pfeifferi TaxID=112525 RepID=A0AAD8F992_BIOPF|nr:rDNA transcriptional regulator pol5 isoform X2 [Biomphalaria pfeifferi]